jgi:probable rRNA maturation factor
MWEWEKSKHPHLLKTADMGHLPNFKALVIFRKSVAGISEASLQRFLARARRAAGLAGRIHVLVTGNHEIRELNRRFRQQNEATDVLSFPAAPPSQGRGQFAGDIAISAQMAAENANALGHSIAEEIRILALHGVLHLAGYDHESDQGRMARKERQLRRALKLCDGLIERTGGAARRARVAAGAQPFRATEGGKVSETFSSKGKTPVRQAR